MTATRMNVLLVSAALLAAAAAVDWLLREAPAAPDATTAVASPGPTSARGVPVSLPDTIQPGDNPLGSMDAAAFSQMLQRPLFSPSRRPPAGLPVPEPQPVVVEPQRQDGFRLIGILSTPEGRVAILRGDAGGEALKATVGMHAGPWSITGITRNAARLERDGEVVELRVFNQREPAR